MALLDFQGPADPNRKPCLARPATCCSMPCTRPCRSWRWSTKSPSSWMNGMAGSAICRALQRAGYSNLLTASRAELDLENCPDVQR